MFDFDTGKLVVVGVVALIVIKPKDLPRVLRTVGSTVSKLRRMATDFQGQFMDAMREADMAGVKEEMNKIAETAKIDVSFDPVRDIRNQISGAIAGETTVQAMAPDALALPDSPASGIDLSHIGETTEAAGDTEGGLVATGIAPGLEAPVEATEAPVEATGEPTTAATIDDVRHALGKELEKEPDARSVDLQPVKEPTA